MKFFAINAGTKAFSPSNKNVKKAQNLPQDLATFVAPIFPEPTDLRSTFFNLAIIIPNGIEPNKYDIAQKNSKINIIVIKV